ncbi:MAG TPA: hypothetical protein VK934_10485 [Fimbriimonas sp.]|nr:hypothetical protein [Fimbriimonas sp.]
MRLPSGSGSAWVTRGGVLGGDWILCGVAPGYADATPSGSVSACRRQVECMAWAMCLGPSKLLELGVVSHAVRDALRRTKLTKAKVLGSLALEIVLVFVVVWSIQRDGVAGALWVTLGFAGITFLLWLGGSGWTFGPSFECRRMSGRRWGECFGLR